MVLLALFLDVLQNEVCFCFIGILSPLGNKVCQLSSFTCLTRLHWDSLKILKDDLGT